MVEKTSRNTPFEVDDEEGKRLISLNVAKDVTAGAGVSVFSGNGEIDTNNPLRNLPEDGLEEMSFSELRQLAKEMGVKGNGNRDELIERLRQCPKWEGEEELLEESDMPELTAEEPE